MITVMDLFRCSQSSDEFLSLLSPVSLLLPLVGGKTLLGTSLTGVSTYIQVYVQKYDSSFGVRFAFIDTLTVALQLSVVMVCLSNTNIIKLLQDHALLPQICSAAMSNMIGLFKNKNKTCDTSFKIQLFFDTNIHCLSVEWATMVCTKHKTNIQF